MEKSITEAQSIAVTQMNKLNKLWGRFARMGLFIEKQKLENGEAPRFYRWSNKEELLKDLKNSGEYDKVPQEVWDSLAKLSKEDAVSLPAKESLTAESTTEEFILEMSKSIARFIVENRTAFAKDDLEAFDEFIEASRITDIRQQALEFIADPSLLEEEEEELLEPEQALPELEDLPQSDDKEEDSLPTEQPEEVNPDMVPDDILKMLED